MAIRLPHWADSSSSDAAVSDDSGPPEEHDGSGRKNNSVSLHSPQTPTKKHKLTRVESTPRRQRALRREILRELKQFAGDNEHSNAPDLDRDRDCDRECEPLDDPANMSGQQGKWREDQVLVICPGSQTTMAQLGCSELTPPAHRIPTRMFKDEDGDGYRPYYTYKRKKAEPAAPADGANEDDKWEWVEDRDSAEGAIYPMQGTLAILMNCKGRLRHAAAVAE